MATREKAHKRSRKGGKEGEGPEKNGIDREGNGVEPTYPSSVSLLPIVFVGSLFSRTHPTLSGWH